MNVKPPRQSEYVIETSRRDTESISAVTSFLEFWRNTEADCQDLAEDEESSDVGGVLVIWSTADCIRCRFSKDLKGRAMI